MRFTFEGTMRIPFKQPLFVLGLLFVCFTAASAQTPAGAGGANASLHGSRMTYQLKGGIVTLYPRDRLASSLCFLDGGDGLIIEQGEVRNRCSHLRLENPALESIGSQEMLVVGVCKVANTERWLTLARRIRSPSGTII